MKRILVISVFFFASCNNTEPSCKDTEHAHLKKYYFNTLYNDIDSLQKEFDSWDTVNQKDNIADLRKTSSFMLDQAFDLLKKKICVTGVSTKAQMEKEKAFNQFLLEKYRFEIIKVIKAIIEDI